MAARKAAQKDQSKGFQTTSDVIEKRVVAFAEQLGSLVGTVQAKTEGWLDGKALSKEISRIRDSATDLLAQVNRLGRFQRKAAAKRTAVAAKRPSRGPVDAPGKRHRKPPPQERIDKRMGEPDDKKIAKTAGRRGARG